MSFILEDENLIINLANGLIKKAQTPPDANAVAKKLINRLERLYTGAPEPLNLSAGTGTPTGLNVPDLQSMGKFLQFLTNNQIKLNGARVGYDGKEYNELPDDEKNKLSTVSVNVSRDADTRKWNEEDYWVNLPLLTQYIKYLQEKASAMEKSGDVQGQILRVMIGKLIDSVNAIKPDSGLTRNKQKSTPENPNELADDTIIDDFNTKILDVRNPYADKGTNQVKLFARDLKGREALNAWLQGGEGGEAKVVMYDSKGLRTEVPFSDEKADSCLAINVLYLRSRRWLQLSKSTDDTKRFSYYAKKIQELGPSFASADGKPCVVGAAIQPGATPTGKPGEAGSATAITPQIIAQIVSTLPFSVRDINLDRIESFFKVVEKVMTNNPQATQRIDMVRRAMDDLNSKYIRNRVVPLGQNLRQFANMLSDQNTPGKQVFPAIALLNQIIDGTRDVVEAFYAAYGNQIKGANTSYLAYILGQIGRNPDDSSIYSRNSDDLENLRTSGKVT